MVRSAYVVRWRHSVVLRFTPFTTNRAVTDLPQQKHILKYSLLFWQVWHRVKKGFFCYREHAYRLLTNQRPRRKLLPHARNVSFCSGQCSSLAHFLSLASFYTSWKYQKNTAFRIFSGSIERDQWYEISYTIRFCL